MNEQEVQKLAADTLLERGVRFPIPAPFLLRIFGKKVINLTLYPPKMGTLISISKGLVDMEVDPSVLDEGDVGKAYSLIAEHGKAMCRIMAIAVLNGKWRIKLFSGILTSWLNWKLDARRLAELFMAITTLSGLQYFTSTIRYLPAMSITKRRSLSPADKGSQEAE